MENPSTEIIDEIVGITGCSYAVARNVCRQIVPKILKRVIEEIHTAEVVDEAVDTLDDEVANLIKQEEVLNMMLNLTTDYLDGCESKED